MPSVVTASVLPYKYLTSKGILKFNRVQVKPLKATKVYLRTELCCPLLLLCGFKEETAEELAGA